MDFYTHSDFAKDRIQTLQAEARQRDLVRRAERAARQVAGGRSTGTVTWPAALRRSVIAFATILLSPLR